MYRVPNRLGLCIEKWVAIGANESVLQWIQEGVSIPFMQLPEPFELHNRQFHSRQFSFISAEIRELVGKGVLRPVQFKPTCVSPISCVPKQGGKLRLITDLRLLNSYCYPQKFSSENITSALGLISSKDHMVTVDLKDGFFHVPVHERDQQYLGIEWNGQYYVFQALPFGLNVSPYYFQKVVRCVIQALRAKGLRIMVYVDDFLLMAPRGLALQQKTLLVTTLRQLGFIINWSKSMLVPDSKVTFLGHILDSEGPDGVPEIRVTPEKVRKLRKDIRRAITAGVVSARVLARIAGQCVFATQAIIPGKLLLRSLYRQIAHRVSWDQGMILNEATIKELA
jgi:hypothetical protein